MCYTWYTYIPLVHTCRGQGSTLGVFLGHSPLYLLRHVVTVLTESRVTWEESQEIVYIRVACGHAIRDYLDHVEVRGLAHSVWLHSLGR